MNLTSTIRAVNKGGFAVGDSVQRSNQSEWVSEGYFDRLMCHTLSTKDNLAVNYDNGTLDIMLMNNLSHFEIYIYDQRYFMLSHNPSFPFNYIDEHDSTSFATYRVKVVEHNDLPIKPCNPSPSYNFNVCIKAKLSQDIGCRLPWDRTTSENVPVCYKMEQFRYILLL